jgi:hypothetical protein
VDQASKGLDSTMLTAATMEVICTSRSRYIDYIDPNHVPQTLWRWFQLPGHNGSQAPHRYVAWWNRKAYGICSVCSVCLEKAVEVCPFQEKTVSSVEMSCIACIPCCHVASDELPAASSSFQQLPGTSRAAKFQRRRVQRRLAPKLTRNHDETWRDMTRPDLRLCYAVMTFICRAMFLPYVSGHLMRVMRLFHMNMRDATENCKQNKYSQKCIEI